MQPNSQVDQALNKVFDRLSAVPAEQISLQEASGRVLAEPLIADRDSPAVDVSAMDGYAIRLDDFSAADPRPVTLEVTDTAQAGREPKELVNGKAVRIFTGAPVPARADCVIRREDTEELPDQVTIDLAELDIRVGQNIRYRAENSSKGQVLLPSGTRVNPATVGCLASFCSSSVWVRRRIAVSLLTSGDELIEPGMPVEAWQIRDSNGPTLRCWLDGLSWTKLIHQSRIQDDLEETRRTLAAAIEQSDVVILTGGVSAGDMDFVPQAIVDLGGEIVFHRLPIRPGKPVLVGFVNETLVIGLPGNPVSTTVTARVVAQPLLERMAETNSPAQLRLPLINPDDKALNLYWYRLVRLEEEGLQLVPSRGSGDLVSLAKSNGFIEIPPGQTGIGPWRTWLW